MKVTAIIDDALIDEVKSVTGGKKHHRKHHHRFERVLASQKAR